MKLTLAFTKFQVLTLSLLVALTPLSTLVVPGTAYAETNLIENGSLDVANIGGTGPEHWQGGGYDNNGHFADNVMLAYVAGRSGTEADKAVSVSITAPISGDAKWTPTNPSTVTPGGFYTFSDWYRSTVTSFLLVEYTHQNASVDYHALATLDATGDAWTQTVQDFDVPSDVASIRVFHLIQSVGTLVTDDYALTAGAQVTDSFDFPIVSITFDDGWTSQYTNALPVLVAKHFPATFYVMSTTTLAASKDLIAIQSQEPGGVTEAATASGTTWSPLYVDSAGTTYRFTDSYIGDESEVTVTYQALGGGAPTTLSLGVLPDTGGLQMKSAFVFTLPAIEPAQPISIAHTSTGTLTAGSGALMPYASGYMNRLQLLDLINAGMEIGVHTEHHCSLSRLVAGLPLVCGFPPAVDATAQSEIEHSKSDLETILGVALSTLAYPYGEYNAEVKTLVAGEGLAAARTVDAGYNRKTADKFALKSQTVDASTTLPEFQGWIQNAITNKLWLILTFHQVENPEAPGSNGEEGGVTIENFNAFMNELESQSVSINFFTVEDALAYMSAVTPDTTAPVITMLGSDPVTLTVGDAYTDAGATAHDDVDGDITASLVTVSTVNTAVPGDYTVTYTAVDISGNEAGVSRTVHVVEVTPDTTKPVITLNGEAVIDLTVGDTYTELGATSTDNVDGDLTSAIVITGTVNTLETETSIVRYNVVDAAGNHADEVTRTIIVHAINHVPDAPPVTAVVSGGGGGGGGGGNGPIIGTVTTPPNFGLVLGAATSSAPQTEACAELISKNLFYLGKSNDPQAVKTLQTFLNTHAGAKLPITGLYATMTRAAVNSFQAEHASEILTPIGLTKPTGVTGPMTRKKINALSCAN